MALYAIDEQLIVFPPSLAHGEWLQMDPEYKQESPTAGNLGGIPSLAILGIILPNIWGILRITRGMPMNRSSIIESQRPWRRSLNRHSGPSRQARGFPGCGAWSETRASQDYHPFIIIFSIKVA